MSGKFLFPLCIVLVLGFGVPASRATAQSKPMPMVSVSPETGGVMAQHVLTAHGLPPNIRLTLLLLAPSGGQLPAPAVTNADGDLVYPFRPPGGIWEVGLYRVAVGLPDGTAYSAVFAASDGGAHLYALPNLPSPTSALMFAGTGLQPDTVISLTLDLTGGQAGIVPLSAHTDDAGNFWLLLWPQQLNLPFFAAGGYRIEVPAAGLSTSFSVREHPAGSTLTGSAAVIPSDPITLTLRFYRPERYVWGVYAGMDGIETGEFISPLLGASGTVTLNLSLAHALPGQYLVATPYDWGETTFMVTTTKRAPERRSSAVSTRLGVARS
jgi:hypothetical protein